MTMITITPFRTLLAILLLGALVVHAPPLFLAIGATAGFFVTGVLVICMLQTALIPSTDVFRLGMFAVAGTCWGKVIWMLLEIWRVPELGKYAFVREAMLTDFMMAMALFAVVTMMRLRQNAAQKQAAT